MLSGFWTISAVSLRCFKRNFHQIVECQSKSKLKLWVCLLWQIKSCIYLLPFFIIWIISIASLLFEIKFAFFIFMRNSEICTYSGCQKRTVLIDLWKKQYEIGCKFKLLSVKKKWLVENTWEERKTLVHENGQEGKGTVPSGGPSCSVDSTQAYIMWEMHYLNKVKWYLSCFCVCLCKQLVMVQSKTTTT